MTIDKENFYRTGPQHLTKIDWNDPYHRRSVAACLVQGVKVMERDRQEERRGKRALASAWWEFFHFEVYREIIDYEDNSVSGAIFEYKSKASQHNNTPKYVVAFRGTIIQPESVIEDIILDVKILLAKLHKSSRVSLAKEAVYSTASLAGGAANIWLAGHSLGAAIAMVAGKYMARKNCPVETFLFNSPFPSVPVERLRNPLLKGGFRMARNGLIAGLSLAVNIFRQKPENDPFLGLYDWTPNLFVNRIDVICSEYIGYFEHGELMSDLGVGKFERLAARNKIFTVFFGVLGKDSDPVHLLPSANLTVNVDPPRNFRQAHGIHQWWRSDTSSKTKLYQFRKEDLSSDEEFWI